VFVASGNAQRHFLTGTQILKVWNTSFVGLVATTERCRISIEMPKDGTFTVASSV